MRTANMIRIAIVTFLASVALTAGAQTAQSITGFAPATPITYSAGGTFPLSATGGGSGNPVVFATTTSTICTVAGSTATVVAVGTCTLTANQAGGSGFNAAAQVTKSVVIKAIVQTISFVQPVTRAFNAPAFPITSSASSGLPVSFSTATSTICTVANTTTGNATVTPLAIGSCSLIATQPGDATRAAVQLTRNVNLTKVTQTITFATLPAMKLGAAPFVSNPTASSTLAVTLTGLTPSICTLSGTTVTLLAIGSCQIAADQPGDATYAAAPRVTRSFTIAKTSQTITFAALPPVLVTAAPFNVSATATSGLSVTLSSITPTICTVAGSQVTLVAAGTCKVSANQAGDGTTWAPATQVVRAFTVAKAAQTINFPLIVAKKVTDPPFTVTATASSNLPVTLTSTTTGVCTINNGSVTLVTVGTCSIAATQVGNATYNVATKVTRSFAVSKLVQKITISAIATQTLGATPLTVTATATSGLTVALTSASPTICTVAGFTVTLISAGSCTLKANQSGNGSYAAAPTATRMFAIKKVPQTITFASLTARALNAGPVVLTASASSGLTVAFSTTTTSVCTVSGSNVALVAPGQCIISADQAGNATYAVAPRVMRSFVVTKLTQSITFAALSAQPLTTAPFAVNANASSGLAVVLTSKTAATCTVSGNTVTLIATGACTLAANQAGSGTYAAASQVTRSFAVTSAGMTAQSITGFAPATPLSFSTGMTFTVSATGGASGNPVTFATNTSSICTVSGSVVTVLTAGTCTVTADQAGSASYSAAPQVSANVLINPSAQTISFAALPGKHNTDAPFTINATASSGLPVAFSTFTPAVCMLSGNTVTLTTVGTCIIAADQPGDATTAPAPQASQSFAVTLGILDGVAMSLAVGDEHACALTTMGGVNCWGWNINGQLGDGTTTDRSTPVDVMGLTSGVTAISAGYGQTCAITTAGAVKCWGTNNSGGLGNGTTQQQSTPVDVIGLGSGISGISVGAGAACALTSGGGVKCWGANWAGQLGDGSGIDQSTPVDVFGLTSGVAKIRGTSLHFCALMIADGSVRCWGSNFSGELGDGTTNHAFTPVPVIGLGVSTDIQAGDAHSCTLNSSGGLKCWGDNAYGELGDGTTVSRGVPMDVVGMTSGVRALSVGFTTTCALRDAGSVSCWGYVPTVTDINAFLTTPQPVSGLNPNLVAVGVGLEASCALGQTGSVQCWGQNYLSQLGDGTTSSRDTPDDVFGFHGAAVSNQTIEFPAVSNHAWNDAAFSVSATASSSLPVSFSSITPTVCSVDAITKIVTLLAGGYCTIAADQAGNASVIAAPRVTQSFSVIGNQIPQAITGFAPVASVVYQAGLTITLAATGGGSGNSVIYSSTTPSICTAGGNVITILATGTCTINADQPGNPGYLAAPTLTADIAIVVPTPQAITGFAPATPIAYATNATFALVATGGGSNNPVNFDSLTPAICTVNGNIVMILLPGTCTLTADQAGDATYASAAQVQVNVVIKADQTITGFAPPTPITYVNGGSFMLSATGGASNSPVTFASTTPAVCDVSGSTALMLSAGVCTLTADQAGDLNYTAAPQVTATITINPASQAISGFNPVTPITYSNAGTIVLTAIGDASGNTVLFASTTPLVCTVAGNIATIQATGTCTLTADQGGSASYNAAPQVTANVTINKAAQTITAFTPATPIAYSSGGTFTVSATGGASGNALTFASTTPTICSMAGNTATVLAVGTCAITASQAGNTNYNAAAPVTASVIVNKGSQTITGFSPATPIAYVNGGTFTLTATGGASGNAIIFASSTPAVCSVAGNIATIQAAGTCTLNADQIGNDNYDAAPRVTVNIAINNSNQVITGFNPVSQIVYVSGGTFTLTATGGPSGNPVTFASSTPAVCSVAGNIVTMQAAGTCTLTANQAGNTTYTAAQQVTANVVINDPATAQAQAPQFRSSSAINGAGTLSFPTGSVSTDWLVMYVISTSTLATPSGWTLSASRNWTAYAYYSYVFTRQKGADTNVVLSPNQGGAVIVAYQKAAGIGAVGTFAESTGSSIVLNSITPQNGQSRVLGIVSDRDPVFPTPPASFTGRASFNMLYFGQNIADRVYASTAPTGTATWGQSATYAAVGVLIELLPAISAPAITEAFSPSSIVANGQSTLTFTLTNANTVALTNANFTDTLVNMSIGSTAIGGTCTGVTNTPALGAGTTVLNLMVPNLPVGSCTVSVQVTSSTPGTNPNTASGVTTTQTPTAGTAANTANLLVSSTAQPAMITNTFSPAWIGTGATSTLTFTLSSPNSVALTSASFTDILTNMNIASSVIGGTCTGVTNSPALTVGMSALNLTIPTIPSNGCTVTVQVTSSTLGSNANVTSGVMSVEAPAGAASNAAYLTVGPADVGFSYVHADHLGTPRAITRPSDNAIVWKWENSDPFGTNQPNEDPANTGTTFRYNLRFPGQYYDQETGTFYNYFRDYDPATGRYIQSDPIGLEAGLNTYAYVGGNPLSFADPKGLFFVIDCYTCMKQLKVYNELIQSCRKSYDRYCYNADGSLDQKRWFNFLQLYGASTDSSAIVNCARQMSIFVLGTNFMGELESCQKCAWKVPSKPFPR